LVIVEIYIEFGREQATLISSQDRCFGPSFTGAFLGMDARHMKHLAYSLFLFLASASLSAQVKFEQERSIKAQAAPEIARKLIAELATKTNIHWYLEQRLEGIAYEAKYKSDGRRYSVEFDQEGVLEDVEREFQWREIPQPAAEAMRTHLDSTYLRHRVRKVQEQFSGSLPAIRERLQQSTAAKSAVSKGNASHETRISDNGTALVLRYEIVVQVKTHQGSTLQELLFDEQGRMLKTATILLRNTDNLAY
jgi:hypothetical protein